MTLEELSGQVLWCGWGEAGEPDPDRYNEHARLLVEELGVGGIVLFPRNLGEPDAIACLVEELQGRARRPLLIGIDQEGGRVTRLPLPGLTFPGNMALGTRDDAELTSDVAFAVGTQLAALGITVDFAPVLDVNNNPANPIIGVRSFGEAAERVARHGVAAVHGFRRAGILPVIKHFPGHGDTAADSHLELPVQRAGRDRLDAVELVPFRAALAAGAPAVMTTHILFPALDPELPATLSPSILGGLLRTELGFAGLVVTDCLEMRGIADHWEPGEAAVRALTAGADMLLVCHTMATQRRMRDAVCDAVRAGRLPEQRLWEAVGRLEEARRQTAAARECPPRRSVVGCVEYRALEERVARECLGEWDPVPGPARPPFDPSLPLLVAGAGPAAGTLAAQLQDAGFRAERGGLPRPDQCRAAPQLIWVTETAGEAEPADLRD